MTRTIFHIGRLAATAFCSRDGRTWISMCSPSARTGRISSNKRIHPTATAIPFGCLMESEYSSVARALVLRTKPHSMITHPSLTGQIFIMNADGSDQVTDSRWEDSIAVYVPEKAR